MELKPCPFCGSPGVAEDHRLQWVVRCTNCTACVLGERAPEPEDDLPDAYWDGIKQTAVSAWNSRNHTAAGSHHQYRRTTMTDQHPLTAEICFDIQRTNKVCYQDEVDLMRAAADWQLEEVMRKVKLKLKEWRIQGYGAGADACEDFFEEVMQELRPQQQKAQKQQDLTPTRNSQPRLIPTAA